MRVEFGSMRYADVSSFHGLRDDDMDSQTDSKEHHIPAPPHQSDSGEAIARQLTGQLHCIGCGYNLHGLSIRSNCSECGIPVRATILGIVDPHADELSSLFKPLLTAIGLNLWSIGAMIAVLMIWVLRCAEVLREFAGTTWTPTLAPWIGLGGLGVSLIGALTLIRPHKQINRMEAIRTAIGVSLYAPLMVVYNSVYLGYDAVSPSPMLDPGSSTVERSVLRIAIFIIAAGIIWSIRPQAVGLAVRSVVVRTGRVDRQSLLAVLASLGVAAFGDIIHVLGSLIAFGFDDVLSIVSIAVIALGSALFSVGMINICLDTIRLYPILKRPGVGLSDIFETNQQKSQRIE